MNEKENWEAVMEAMKTADVTLSQKLSYTYKKSLTGLLFILARYKFCMKMMMNRKNLKIIDFGCNDGTGDLLIAQNADLKELIGVDSDKDAIKWANDHIANDKLKFIEADFLGKIFGGGRFFDFIRCDRTYSKGERRIIQRHYI